MNKYPPPFAITAKQRIIGIDVLRVLFALCIFCFHSRVHLGCDFGVFNYFFDDASLAMSGFFVLSGYSLWIAYGNKLSSQVTDISNFYLKRLISIYPLYIVIGTLAVVMNIGVGRQTIVDNLLLLPVEVLGIQSFFDGSLFGYAHNGGTWFVSCILVCYLVFPLVKILTENQSNKTTIWSSLILILLIIYVHLLPLRFECGDLYTNAFFRVLEFVLGIMLAKVNYTLGDSSKFVKYLHSTPVILMVSVVLIIGFSYLNYHHLKSESLVYTGLALLFIGLGTQRTFRNKVILKTVLYVSSISYSFYMCQFLVWNPFKFIQMRLGELGNLALIMCALILNILLSILFYEFVEKRFGNYLRLKLVEK